MHDAQHLMQGALIEAVPGHDSMTFRLVSVYIGNPMQVWNVTLDPVPKSLGQAGVIDRMRIQLRRHIPADQQAQSKSSVAALADTALQTLCDGFAGAQVPDRLKLLAQQFDALGLNRIAVQFSNSPLRDADAVLRLAWELMLVRRATRLLQSR